MTRTTLISIFIIGFSMVLSERITVESMAFGILVALMMYMLNGHLKGPIGEEKYCILGNVNRYGAYLCLLVKEVVLANVQVARIVLSRKISISPTIITYETKLKSLFHRTVLANSITLTPGTLTVSLVDNIVTIHCLREEYKEHIVDSKLEKILLQIEEYQR